MRKKILTLVAVMAMGATLITGCGKDKVDEDATKEVEVVKESEAVETKESEAVVETAEPETVVETEPTGTVETTETTEEVTETAVAEPKFKVEIVGKIESQSITIASVTNISNETYGFFPSGMACKEDPFFKPGEITYVCSCYDMNEDEITAEIEHSLTEKGNNYDTVTHMDTYTAEQFADAIALAERIASSNGTLYAYAILHFNDDTFLGMDNNSNIWVDETTHELRLMYEEANKIIVLWYEITE